MKSPFKWRSSLSRHRHDHHLLGNRIEGIYCFCSNVHDSTSVLFLPWSEGLCHQEILPFWKIFSSRISQISPPTFSSSFLSLLLVEGRGFFHSHCKTLSREQSQDCLNLHILVFLQFLHLLGVPDNFWKGDGYGEVLALGSLGLFVRCELTN